MLNIALIGYGGMGHFHGDKMRTVDGIRLAGIYDIDPERCKFAESEGIHAYSSRAELLADPEIELVVVATPNDVHKEIALDAFAAGKNVISEKPVAMNSAELEEMIAAASRAGKLFTVHQNRRWDEDYLTVKKMVDSRELGNVFRIESRVMGSRGIPSGWREEKEHGGGMVLDWGVHLLDQMLTMMGSRKLLSVMATETHITNDECDDGFTAFCRFEGGIEWIVEVGTCNYIEMPRWYVFGDAGSAVIRNWACEGEVVKIFNRGEDDVAPIQAGAGITRKPLSSKALQQHSLTGPLLIARKTDFCSSINTTRSFLQCFAAPMFLRKPAGFLSKDWLSPPSEKFLSQGGFRPAHRQHCSSPPCIQQVKRRICFSFYCIIEVSKADFPYISDLCITVLTFYHRKTVIFRSFISISNYKIAHFTIVYNIIS